MSKQSRPAPISARPRSKSAAGSSNTRSMAVTRGVGTGKRKEKSRTSALCRHQTGGSGKRQRVCVRWLGAPRCAKTKAKCTASAAYTGYGRSSDPAYDKPLLVSNFPSPMTQLMYDVCRDRIKARCLAKKGCDTAVECATQSESSQATQDSCAAHNESNVDREEAIGAEQDIEDDDEEDEEDEEKGMPNAVRPRDPLKEVKSTSEILKQRHVAAMETITRSLKPGHVTTHLMRQGYFNHRYNNHSRTNSDNLNLKNGAKKAMERLYQLLAVHA